VYDPSAAPSPPVAVSSPGARYAYLVARLRNRQITMEEATELFSIQQTLISRASVMNQAPPPPPEEAADEAPAPPPAPSGNSSPFSDENLAMTLLAMGVGAGLLAAVVKRARDGPKPTR
jgi:hypothetical protein